VLAALFITLREGFEAALVVAVVLAYLRKLDTPGGVRSVWLGVFVAAGVSAAVATGLFLTGGDLKGSAESLFEGGVMLAAVAMLTWMMFWMQRQASTQGAQLREHVDAALEVGGALFGLAFLAVVREGLETALFLFAAAGKTRPAATVIGALLGLAAAGVAGYAVYRGSRRLPLRAFFTVTNIVLVGFAVYLVWRGVHDLGEVVGGRAFAIIGPMTAVAYGVAAVIGLRRVNK
jgi:high-affinity iron transporter